MISPLLEGSSPGSSRVPLPFSALWVGRVPPTPLRPTHREGGGHTPSGHPTSYRTPLELYTNAGIAPEGAETCRMLRSAEAAKLGLPALATATAAS